MEFLDQRIRLWIITDIWIIIANSFQKWFYNLCAKVNDEIHLFIPQGFCCKQKATIIPHSTLTQMKSCFPFNVLGWSPLPWGLSHFPSVFGSSLLTVGNHITWWGFISQWEWSPAQSMSGLSQKAFGQSDPLTPIQPTGYLNQKFKNNLVIRSK